MAKPIKLVQNDQHPALILSIADQDTGIPIDFAHADDVVRFRFREVGTTEIKDTVTCSKLTGKLVVREDGTSYVDESAPYDVAGAGGRCSVDWNADSLDTDGSFEAEVEIEFASGQTLTIYDFVKFTIRKQMG